MQVQVQVQVLMQDIVAGAGVHIDDGAFLGADASIGVTFFLQFCRHPLLPSGYQQDFYKSCIGQLCPCQKLLFVWVRSRLSLKQKFVMNGTLGHKNIWTGQILFIVLVLLFWRLIFSKFLLKPGIYLGYLARPNCYPLYW